MISKRVIDLNPGDIIDLAGDRYADPTGASTYFECEYAMVSFVRSETPDCIVVGIDGVDWFGFPPDHEVPFIEATPEYEP